MDKKRLERMQTGKGFIAALDQSGGSTPKALALYGVSETAYHNEEEMYALIHQMRTRIMTGKAFTSDYIIGAILFENTLDREVNGMKTSSYLLSKNILPFLKIDKGLAAESDGCQLMKPMPELDALLKKAVDNQVFGTKMRSVIKSANEKGIAAVVAQQFELAKKIIGYGLVPIIEPEIDINIPDKAQAEVLLKKAIFKEAAKLKDEKVIYKITLPSVDGFYSDLAADKHTVRVVALSGGYDQKTANAKLAKNKGVIASFSRATTEGLSVKQSDAEFNEVLGASIRAIASASNT